MGEGGLRVGWEPEGGSQRSVGAASGVEASSAALP